MEATVGFRPLYQQVYDLIIKKISDGTYVPGEMLPSEQQLAKQLNVSQGTVRKALDAMTAEKILERRQGKGTFVSSQTPERSALRFFGFSKPDGQELRPENDEETIKRRKGTARELDHLDNSSDEIYEIARVRSIEGKPTIIEKIVICADIFDGIQDFSPINTELYSLYQKSFGVHVISTNDEISAVNASKTDAKKLGVDVGAPLLNIQRSTFDIHKRCIEYRSTRVDTRGIIYSATL